MTRRRLGGELHITTSRSGPIALTLLTAAGQRGWCAWLTLRGLWRLLYPRHARRLEWVEPRFTRTLARKNHGSHEPWLTRTRSLAPGRKRPWTKSKNSGSAPCAAPAHPIDDSIQNDLQVAAHDRLSSARDRIPT